MPIDVILGIAFSGYASVVIQVGIDKLWDVLANHYSSDRFGSKSDLEMEIRRMERVMTTINNLLNEFNGVDDRGMQLWLRELRDIAFKADNFIDELHVMFKMDSDVKTHKNKMQEFFSKFRESRERRNQTIKNEIANFTNTSDKVLKEQRNLIETIQTDRTMRRSDCTMAQSSTYQSDTRVFGREDEKSRLIDLICSQSKNEYLSIIPITGMVGIGKTTLARYVYNDPTVQGLFEIKAWVSLGVKFDLKQLTQVLLEAITGEVCSISNLNKLQELLHSSLNGKLFLIVLDGAWNEKKDDWDKLLGPLRTAVPGSVVLVTTQSPTVASTIGTTDTLQLNNLSKQDCESIFWKYACREEQAWDQELHNISNKIITRCYGIPLVAKTFGELLWMKKDKNEWKFILETDIHKLPGFANEILDGLRLSYSMLPVHLQPCITYCAIFPKDYTFEKDTIIQLWMAEEILNPNKRVRMEDTGSLYFDELVHRSFFEKIPSVDEAVLLYKINHLVYDMVQLVAGDSSFRAVVEEGSSPHNESLVRHLVIMCIKDDEGLERLKNFNNLRSFMLFLKTQSMVKEIPGEFLESMQSIRVLDLKGSGITELPKSIGNLKLLRYLDLSGTKIVEICRELCALFMLQTLKLTNCEKLCVLPKAFGNLYNLRTLEMNENKVGLPPRMGNLSMLQELKMFDVRKEDGYKLCELENMLELREALRILKLENVSSVDEARSANMGSKEHLSRLQLEWGQREHQCENEGQILESLQPHHNLKNLTIKGYLVNELPNWVWNTATPSNLLEIDLVDCNNLGSVGPLKCLKALKILRLRGNIIVAEIDDSFFGILVDAPDTGFSSLEILHLHNWSMLRRWTRGVDSAFKLLHNVMIQSCQSVESLPDFNSFCSLRTLEIGECPKLVVSQGGRPETLQRLVYKGCSMLGEDSDADAGWPFAPWLPVTENDIDNVIENVMENVIENAIENALENAIEN